MKLWIIVVKFLFFGALFIVSNQNLYLSENEDMNAFLNFYYSWLNNLYTHVQDITGYVVNSEWLPVANSTVEGFEIVGG